MLEGRLLHYFLVVAREQNMTRAAAELHISQPALSAQIADLERQLGKKLFRRTNKSTILTEDGILFRARAQELIELTNKIESEFTSESGDIAGDIYLGCGETHIMSHISAVFREIQKEHPNIHLHIYSGDANFVLDRLDIQLLPFRNFLIIIVSHGIYKMLVFSFIPIKMRTEDCIAVLMGTSLH